MAGTAQPMGQTQIPTSPLATQTKGNYRPPINTLGQRVGGIQADTSWKGAPRPGLVGGTIASWDGYSQDPTFKGYWDSEFYTPNRNNSWQGNETPWSGYYDNMEVSGGSPTERAFFHQYLDSIGRSDLYAKPDVVTPNPGQTWNDPNTGYRPGYRPPIGGQKNKYGGVNSETGAGIPMTGGQTQKANPMDMGRYVGNPNHIAQQQLIKNNPNILDASPMPTVSQTPGLQGIRDANGNLVNNNVYNMGGATNNQGQIQVGGATAPPPMNINTLAAEGIKAAGYSTGQGLGFTPQQVAVAGNSATVNPNNVVGSNVVNANVVGSNITADQIAQQNASPQVMAERLANTNMAQYMNPYTDQVIRANETDVLRGANMGLDMLGAQAQAAGGFGGSRHGIAMGEMGRGVADTLARTSAGLRQAGYQNAQQMAGQDIANNFQSQMANQQGGQFDINTNMAAQRANQAANLQASQQNQQNALQAALANQSAGMQSGLANQSNALQTGLANQNYNFQGQMANQQAGQQDIQNRLQAALANQSAGLSGNSQRMGAAQQLGQLSNLGFDMGQTVNNNLQNQGAMQQAMQQILYDNAQNKFNQFIGQPVNSLGYLNNALGVTPQVNSKTLTSNKGLFDYLTLGASLMPRG